VHIGKGLGNLLERTRAPHSSMPLLQLLESHAVSSEFKSPEMERCILTDDVFGAKRLRGGAVGRVHARLRRLWEGTSMGSGLPGELRAVHRGPVIGPGDPQFDAARRTFNALIEARPLVIARPVDAADVAAVISVALRAGVPVSVRGGGHSVAGHCVGEGGVMIDLRLMREVRVETDVRRARVGGGACWNDVDAPTQAEGLAVPGGTYGDTGVAGLALTGGIGHLVGSFGLTLDSLV
jgi:hypothetical protein